MQLIQWLIGPLLTRVVMPAQNRKDTFKDLRKLKSKEGVRIDQQYIDSSHGAKINVASFKKKGSPKSKRVIVFAVGNGHGYETKFNKLVYMAKRYPDATIMAFNFRNVLGSTGPVFGEQDWVDDAKAVAKHIKAQGFKNEHILFNGFSLGGAISTIMIAQLYQEERAAAKSKEERDSVQAIRIINQRSLSSLVNVLLESTLGQNICAVVNTLAYGGLTAGLLGAATMLGLSLGALPIGLIGGAIGLTTGMISLLHPRVCFGLSKPLGHLAGILTVGRIFALDAFLKIPEEARDFMMAKHDSKIPKSISLGHGVKAFYSKKKNAIWRQLKPLLQQKENAKTSAQASKIEAKIKPLMDELINMKDSKIKHRYHPQNGHLAHNDDLSFFTTYNSLRKQQISGQQALENKIERMMSIKPAKV